MNHLFNSFFSSSSKRSVQANVRHDASKKTLTFESLESRHVMHGDALEIPTLIDSSEPQICTAMTIEQFTAQTGIVVVEGDVKKLPETDGGSYIIKVDGPELIVAGPGRLDLLTTPPLFEAVKGDANSDGFIDQLDYAAWEENYTGDFNGTLPSPLKTFEQGDFDGDGDVDLNDLGWWSANYTGPEPDIVDAPQSFNEDTASSVDEPLSDDVAQAAPPTIAPAAPASDELSDGEPAVSEPSIELSTSPIANPTLGDADSDDDIDNDDFLIWEENYTGDFNGTLASALKTFAQGDFDGDGDVDLNDLAWWSSRYTGPIEVGNS